QTMAIRTEQREERKVKIDLSTILKDAKNYPDDMEITLANGAVLELGSIREYDAATQGSVQAELEKERKSLAADRTKLEKANNEVAQMYVSLEQEKAKIEELKKGIKQENPHASKDDLTDLLEADPVYSRLNKRYGELESKLDAIGKNLDTKFGQITSTLNEVGQT